MSDASSNPPFAPLTLDVNVNSIRLFLLANHPTLTMLSRRAGDIHTLSLLSLAVTQSTNPSRLRELEAPFGNPFWDVTSTGAGAVVVWTMPGSAICPLGYAFGDGTAAVLTAAYPAGVFQNPRFSRGRSAINVTATASAERDPAFALFRNITAGDDAHFATLPSSGEGIPLEGILLQGSAGYLLLSKLLPPHGREAERTDLRGESLRPGILRCSHLDSNFTFQKRAASPLGATTIFEFDADIYDGRILLFATTTGGYACCEGRVEAGELIWQAVDTVETSFDLLSPALVIMPGTATMAAIERSTDGTGQILIGTFK